MISSTRAFAYVFILFAAVAFGGGCSNPKPAPPSPAGYQQQFDATIKLLIDTNSGLPDAGQLIDELKELQATNDGKITSEESLKTARREATELVAKFYQKLGKKFGKPSDTTDKPSDTTDKPADSGDKPADPKEKRN